MIFWLELTLVMYFIINVIIFLLVFVYDMWTDTRRADVDFDYLKLHPIKSFIVWLPRLWKIIYTLLFGIIILLFQIIAEIFKKKEEVIKCQEK